MWMATHIVVHDPDHHIWAGEGERIRAWSVNSSAIVQEEMQATRLTQGKSARLARFHFACKRIP